MEQNKKKKDALVKSQRATISSTVAKKMKSRQQNKTHFLNLLLMSLDDQHDYRKVYSQVSLSSSVNSDIDKSNGITTQEAPLKYNVYISFNRYPQVYGWWSVALAGETHKCSTVCSLWALLLHCLELDLLQLYHGGCSSPSTKELIVYVYLALSKFVLTQFKQTLKVK